MNDKDAVFTIRFDEQAQADLELLRQKYSTRSRMTKADVLRYLISREAARYKVKGNGKSGMRQGVPAAE